MEIEHFLSLAANQSFSVMLLGIAVYYFYKRQAAWESKIEELHTKRTIEREQLISLTTELKQVISQNTQILESIKVILNERDKDWKHCGGTAHTLVRAYARPTVGRFPFRPQRQFL